MYKTKIKRFQLTIDIILIALFAMAASIMLVSAYGAVCITYNLPTGRPSPPFPAGETWWDLRPWFVNYASTYIGANIITWAFAFVWGIVIWAFITKKRWAHWGAVATAVIGTLSGLIPAVLSDTSGFTQPFPDSIGSPHWGRTLMNLVVLMVLAIVLIIPATRKGLLSFTAKGDRVVGNVARQLVMMSFFFFWLAAFSFLGTEFMRGAHVIDGINVWQTVEIQTWGGIVTALVGSSMLASGAIVYYVKRPSSAIMNTM
ncbi:MAG: hypothetical protein ACW98D_13895 [Promethearchaeota archaeon]